MVETGKSYKLWMWFNFMKLLISILLMVNLVSIVSADCGDGQIDINSASLTELDELSGIGPVKAQAIVDTRPFGSVDDLINVYGIGEVTLEKIKTQGLACVDGEEIDEDIVDEIEVVEEEVEEISPVGDDLVETKKGTEIILLNSEEVVSEELIYVSKNAKVVDYLVYVFAIFLVVVIGFLIWERF